MLKINIGLNCLVQIWNAYLDLSHFISKATPLTENINVLAILFETVK